MDTRIWRRSETTATVIPAKRVSGTAGARAEGRGVVGTPTPSTNARDVLRTSWDALQDVLGRLGTSSAKSLQIAVLRRARMRRLDVVRTASLTGYQ
jgi:hypothetical protein